MIREFDFTVGPETSELPGSGTPTSDADLITLGFADARYTQGSEAVADNAALKAIAEADRRDGDFVLIKDSNRVYRFDSASALADDANFVLAPDAGTGRWIRLTLLNQANTFTQDQTIDGNLTVNGTTTTVDSETLDVKDPNIGVNRGGNQSTANTNVSGFTVQMTDATNAQVGYDSSLASKFKAGDVGSESEIITAGTAQTITGLKQANPGIEFDTLSATPANASTNYIKLYAKDDGRLYYINAAGTEFQIDVDTDVITTQGDIIIGDGSGNPSRLALGANGTVPQSNGATITWQAVGTGDVSAAANFANDNRLLRSDGTLKGAQASGVDLDDSDNFTNVNGITFNAGSTALTHYETSTFSSTFTYNTSGTSVSVDFRLVRVGNNVTMTADSNNLFTPGSNASSMSSDSNIAANFRPSANFLGVIRIQFNGSSNRRAGLVQITTAGVVSILPDVASAGNTFLSSGAGGWPDAFTVSWAI